LNEGAFGIATSITFVNKQALAHVMGVSPQSASYILVKPRSGIKPEALVARLKEKFPETTLLDQQEFIESDKEMIRQMGADIIRAMNTISYIVGILVIGLTIYTATLERSREYAVLKAIGAKMRHLILIVFLQAYTSSMFGALLGLGVAAGLAAVISQVFPEMLVLLERDYIIQQLPVILLVTGIAALIPLRRIRKLDPLIVFQE
jgi:putative ABC transport system permease protein